ncbi:hypothetical protein GCM10017562_67700 [Streptomyces roseofulvus]|uniref:hypothetical protein n=1 Tax=Streptomyces roseofulvus TaxID=33902 RepID=UPI0031FC8CC5
MITLTHSGEETLSALREACLHAGFDATRAQLIRALDNGIWRLSNGAVARVHQPGTRLNAQKEIGGAYWLYGNGIPVSLPRRSEPVVAAGRPVTFWTDLGPGGPANPADAARILRALHRLPVPADLRLPSHAPFARFPAQIAAAHATPGEKDWGQPVGPHTSATPGGPTRPATSKSTTAPSPTDQKARLARLCPSFGSNVSLPTF